MIPERRAKRGVESKKIDSVSEVSAKSSSSAESSLDFSISNRRGKRQPLGLLSTKTNMDNATKDQLSDLEVEEKPREEAATKKSRVSEPKMVNTTSSSSSVQIRSSAESKAPESDAAESSIAMRSPSLKSGERRSSRQFGVTVTGGEDVSDSSDYIPITKKKLNQQKLFVVQESSKVRRSPRLATLKKRKELSKDTPAPTLTYPASRKR